MMTKKALLLLIAVLSAMFVLSAAPVSAQDPDLDSMTDQEILLLLQSILQKLEQGDTASSEPAPGPVAVNEPETTPETGLFQIYENKKLIIEALPSYMFLKPEKKNEEPEAPDTEKKEDNGGDDSACPPITPCVPGSDDYCEQWITPEGTCVCMC